MKQRSPKIKVAEKQMEKLEKIAENHGGGIKVEMSRMFQCGGREGGR